MAQLMQPLPGFRDQSPATGFGQRLVALKAALKPLKTVLHTSGEGNRWRLRQLTLHEQMKALLPPLQIATTGLGFKREGLLQGFHPTQQLAELNVVQSPGVWGLGSKEVCQGFRASRSRQRRSQWRC